MIRNDSKFSPPKGATSLGQTSRRQASFWKKLDQKNALLTHSKKPVVHSRIGEFDASLTSTETYETVSIYFWCPKDAVWRVKLFPKGKLIRNSTSQLLNLRTCTYFSASACAGSFWKKLHQKLVAPSSRAQGKGYFIGKIELSKRESPKTALSKGLFSFVDSKSKPLQREQLERLSHSKQRFNEKITQNLTFQKELRTLVKLRAGEVCNWWARGASSPGPPAYQAGALTRLSHGPARIMVPGPGFEPGASALPRRRSYQAELPAHSTTP